MAAADVVRMGDGDIAMDAGDEVGGGAPPPVAPRRPRQMGAAAVAVSAERAEVSGSRSDALADKVQKTFLDFLQRFTTDDGTPYYVQQLDTMESTEATTLVVNWTHLTENDSQIWQDTADNIQLEYYRFEPYLRNAVRQFVGEHKPNYVANESAEKDAKDFYLSITHLNIPHKLRDLKTALVGQLCCFQGTVTRTTEVRPELIQGTFQCLDCGITNASVQQQFKYTEPKICKNTGCVNAKNWNLDVEQSQFVDWQKARVQENSVDIPPGAMPRSMDVIFRGEVVEHCKPGDNVILTGTLIVVPNVANYYARRPTMLSRASQGGGGFKEGGGGGVTGLKALGVRELSYKLVFLCNFVTTAERQLGHSDMRGEEVDDVVATLTEADVHRIMTMKETPKIYQRLAESIAPNIWGHTEVKRGILLQLFGGVMKRTHDGIKLRGDVNVCLIGDPSTAKSQFLKYVTRVLPRTIYTSGKASTAAGLTAAVMRDPETGEFGVEAGALMLADNGICCIDEFDKMDELDQAAIHEAMEQQTITITKAGIQATLNARASILAAANPMWGRYDTSKPLRYNVNISPPIMSRFDLFFVVLDECDDVTDWHVASHIVKLHCVDGGDARVEADFSTDDIQKYVRYARTLKPQITEEAKHVLVRHYRQLRQRDATDQKAYRFTVRQLESLIRLSEALARVRLDEFIKVDYVNEAARLLKSSIISVDAGDVELEGPIDLSGASAGVSEGSSVDAAAAPAADDLDGSELADGSGVQPETERISIPYVYYIRTANLIAYHIRREESQPHEGIRQAEMEKLVLAERYEDDGSDNLEALAKEQRILQIIVQRLIEIDNVLIVKKDAEHASDRVLMVHPNYDADMGYTKDKDYGRPEVALSEEDEDDAADVGTGEAEPSAAAEAGDEKSAEEETQPRRGRRRRRQSTPAEDQAAAKEAMDFE